MELLGAKLDGGRYEIMQRIATGAMGVVYRGRQAPLGREVAIKLLRESRVRCQHSISAFWREARAASMIDHPNVVRVIDFGLDRDFHYFIVMELLEGGSLEDVLGSDPLPSLRWSCEIIAQLLSALAAAHDAGVVHQDVKPGNVKLHRAYDANGEEVEIPKLCDFGLAALLRVTVVDDTAHGTTRDELWGTPEYMSPEQARGERPTPSTDIYACGVMLYQMATGQLPFEGKDPTAIAAQHVECAPTPPSEVRPGLDPALEAVILRALSKRPEDRFANAREMRVALLAALPPTRRASDRESAGGEARPPGERESGEVLRRASQPVARRATDDEPTAPMRLEPSTDPSSVPLPVLAAAFGLGRESIAVPAGRSAHPGLLEALPDLRPLKRSSMPLWMFGAVGVLAGIAVLWLLASLR